MCICDISPRPFLGLPHSACHWRHHEWELLEPGQCYNQFHTPHTPSLNLNAKIGLSAQPCSTNFGFLHALDTISVRNFFIMLTTGLIKHSEFLAWLSFYWRRRYFKAKNGSQKFLLGCGWHPEIELVGKTSKGF